MLGFRHGQVAHGRQLEIFAPEQISRGQKKNDQAQTADEEERHRDEIDQDREQSRPRTFERGAQRRWWTAERICGVVCAFHFERDVVDEESSDQSGHCRHQEDRSDNDAEAHGDGNDPSQDRERRMCASAEQALGPIHAIGGKPDQQALNSDADDHDQDESEPDGFPQHRAERW